MEKNSLLLFVYLMSLNLGICQQRNSDAGAIRTELSINRKVADKFNLDFEYPLSGPKNTWMVLNDDFRVELDTIDKVHGKNSLKFSKTYLATEYEVCLFQKILLPQPCKEIKIALFSKSDQLEAAWLKVAGFNKNMVKVTSDSINIVDTTQWKEFTTTLSYDDQIYMVSLDIRARETFKTKKRTVSFWVDNMSINIDDKAIATLSNKAVEFGEIEFNEINNNIPLNSRLEIPLYQLSQISKNKIVGFGETVHGSKDIHQAVFNNIRQLISNFNCRLVLLEIPIETGLLLNQFVNEDIITLNKHLKSQLVDSFLTTWELNWKTKVTKKLGSPPCQSLEFLCNLSNSGNFLKSVSEVSDIICLSIISFICSTPNGYSQFFPVDTAKLNTAYRALVKDRNSAEKQQRFLDAFPSTFDDFNMTYQFFDNKDYDLTMYNLSVDHIRNGLAKLDLIADSIYYDKLINLSFGGRYNVDAPNYFKAVLKTILKEDTESFFQRLSNFNEGQLISFWFFYFNSRFEKDYVADFEKFKKLKSEFPNVVNAMVIAYPAACGKVWY